jgi:tetratricopeptide (TPR) repeat protein
VDDPFGPRGAAYRAQAAEAVDKAIALDPSNSEAIDIKAFLAEPTDMVGRAALLEKALDARPLACGCEHHLHGIMLQAVGRNRDSVDEYRRSTDVLALDFDSQLGLADSLAMTGKSDEAKQHFDAAADLSSDAAVNDTITIFEVPVTGDYAAGLKALANPKLNMPDGQREALRAAYQAMISKDPAAKGSAVQMLVARPSEAKGRAIVSALAALGANREAMDAIADRVQARWLSPAGWLFLPQTRGLLDDPDFPSLATKTGLMKYWKTTHTKPDVCSDKNAPRFCAMI